MAAENSTTSTVLNKILIPVITTVLGATAIYFLGFNNKKGGRSDMEKMLLTKEATVTGWKSFVTAQNITYKNTMSLTKELNAKVTEVLPQVQQEQSFEPIIGIMDNSREEFQREYNKFFHAMDEILKKEDLDKDFISMINRVVDNGKTEMKKLTTFFDAMIKVARSNINFTEKGRQWQVEGTRFESMAEGMQDRAATEAEEMAKILSERYNQAFNLNDLQVYLDYQKEKNKKLNGNDPKDDNEPAPRDPKGGTEYIPEDGGNTDQPGSDKITKAWLTGKWKLTGGAITGTLQLGANGDMYWEFDGRGYTSGDWKLVTDKLQMNATNPDTKKTSVLIGSITNVTDNSFTYTLQSNPPEVYHFKRAK